MAEASSTDSDQSGFVTRSDTLLSAGNKLSYLTTEDLEEEPSHTEGTFLVTSGDDLADLGYIGSYEPIQDTNYPEVFVEAEENNGG